MTPAELLMLIERHPKLVGEALNAAIGKPKHQRESQLHKQISQECHRRGFIALHGAMHKATSRTAGEPDFTVLLPNGKIALIEVKTTNGKLSDDQERLHGKAWALGHTVHVVRSFVEFLDIIKDEEASDE